VLYLGLLPTALAFWTWSYALAHMPAGRLAATTYIVPTLTVLMAWPILGEIPTTLALLGGILCLAGVTIANRKPRTAASEPVEPSSMTGDSSTGHRSVNDSAPVRSPD